MSATIKRFLVIRANGDVRLVQRRPSLDMDEIAVPLVIHIPDGWARVVEDQIDIHMPGPPSIEPVNPDAIVAGAEEEEEVQS